MRPRMMLAVLGCSTLAGCGLDTTPDKAEAPAPIETYRTAAAFDPAGRVFLHNQMPAMATVLHAEFVEEFIGMPSQGGGRIIIMPSMGPRTWIEIVAESQSETILGQTQPVYDPLRETLTAPDDSVRSVRERFWRVRDRQLMSVDPEFGPAVYLIDANQKHLAMRGNGVKFEGKTAAKRDLTEFETAALEKLKTGDDVALRATENEMHVVGAIRARGECLSCHKTAKVGTMLGAFSYTLLRVLPETPEKDCLQDLAGLSADERSAVATIEAAGGTVERVKNGPVTGITLQKAISDSVRGGPHPRHVDAPYSRSRDAALNVLDVFPNLQSLDLSGSLVTDEGLKQVAKLKKLKKLDLCSSSVTPEGVEKLKKALPGCDIKFMEMHPAVP